MSGLAIQGLSHAFGARRVVKDVSLEVAESLRPGVSQQMHKTGIDPVNTTSRINEGRCMRQSIEQTQLAAFGVGCSRIRIGVLIPAICHREHSGQILCSALGIGRKPGEWMRALAVGRSGLLNC